MARASSSLRQRKKEMENQPRRICRLPVGPQAKDIIGKVMYLIMWHFAEEFKPVLRFYSSIICCIIVGCSYGIGA